MSITFILFFDKWHNIEPTPYHGIHFHLEPYSYR